MEKRFVVLSFMFLLIAAITLTMVSAQVTITKQAVSTLAIKDLNKPAIFNLALTNNGNADSFTIYSTVGLGVEPNESFDMATGETKNIVLKVYPSLPITSSPDYYSFEYKIKAVNSDVQKEDLAVTFVY